MTPIDDHGPDPVIELLDEAEAAGIEVNLADDSDTITVTGPASEAVLIQRIEDQRFAVMQVFWKWQSSRLLTAITDPKIRLEIFEVGHDVRARRDLAARSATEVEWIAFGAMLAASIEREVYRHEINHHAGQ